MLESVRTLTMDPLSPHERRRVVLTAIQQAAADRGYPGLVAPALNEGIAPWFQHPLTGRPIWLTPADRDFLRVNRISAV